MYEEEGRERGRESMKKDKVHSRRACIVQSALIGVSYCTSSPALVSGAQTTPIFVGVVWARETRPAQTVLK